MRLVPWNADECNLVNIWSREQKIEIFVMQTNKLRALLVFRPHHGQSYRSHLTLQSQVCAHSCFEEEVHSSNELKSEFPWDLLCKQPRRSKQVDAQMHGSVKQCVGAPTAVECGSLEVLVGHFKIWNQPIFTKPSTLLDDSSPSSVFDPSDCDDWRYAGACEQNPSLEVASESVSLQISYLVRYHLQRYH